MRRVLTSLILLSSVVLLALPGLANAEPEAGSTTAKGPRALDIEFGVTGGIFFPDKEHEYYDSRVGPQQELAERSPDFGLRLGFFPLAFLGIEGEGSVIGSETAETHESVTLLSLRGQVIAQFPARLTPFVVAGMENVFVRSSALGDDRDREWHVGLGAKFFVTNNFQLRLDGRLYRSNRLRDGLDDNGDINQYGATASMVLVLGKRAAAKVAPVDRDGDGINDDTDECPDVSGVAPTGCPPKDSDGDGMNDDADSCPDKPETVNGHEDADGCPDELPDPDGDGLRGEADQCATEAEDVDGYLDEDGCPEVDNDGDQLLDAADGCPVEAGPAENRGCPDKDRDADTVVDRLDNCPDEAGKPEFQGCKSKQLVVLTQTQLKILDKVYFKTGKAVLDRKSFKLLDNIASVLAAHPEIAKIRIEGHTDAEGPDDQNKELSQKRAESVAVYLVKKGVPVERLEPVGFGEEKPISDNETPAGRADNRRVEFNIVGDAPPAELVPTP